MSDLWLPGDSDDPYGIIGADFAGANTTSTNCTTTIDLESFKEFATECDRMKREQLRRESEMVEQPCPVCGRRPIVRGGGFGTTYVVCPHMLAEIKRQCKPAKPPGETPDGMPPIGWSPYGVNIEVFDDGPSRW